MRLLNFLLMTGVDQGLTIWTPFGGVIISLTIR